MAHKEEITERKRGILEWTAARSELPILPTNSDAPPLSI